MRVLMAFRNISDKEWGECAWLWCGWELQLRSQGTKSGRNRVTPLTALHWGRDLVSLYGFNISFLLPGWKFLWWKSSGSLLTPLNRKKYGGKLESRWLFLVNPRAHLKESNSCLVLNSDTDKVNRRTSFSGMGITVPCQKRLGFDGERHGTPTAITHMLFLYCDHPSFHLNTGTWLIFYILSKRGMWLTRNRTKRFKHRFPLCQEKILPSCTFLICKT